MLTKAAFIWQKHSKNNNIVKYYYNLKFINNFNIFSNILFPVMEEMNYQQSLLQSSVSHDASEIIISWFSAQKTFLIKSQCYK